MSPFTTAHLDANAARDEFIDAYTILNLETGQKDVLDQCEVMDKVYLAYLQQFGDQQAGARLLTFDYEMFNGAYDKLVDALQTHQSNLGKPHLQIPVPLPALKR